MRLRFKVIFIFALLPVAAALLCFPGGARGGQTEPDYTPLKKQMEEFIAVRKGSYGIYFQDLGSGKSFGIHENTPLTAASTVKLPMTLYLYTLAADGKLNWQTRVAYQQTTDYEGGNGILRYTARDGDRFSLRTLNTLMLVLSDNIAFRMLARHLGRDNFRQFMLGLGGKTVYPGGKNLTTAQDLGVYLQAALDFVRRHPEEGKRLLDDLAHSIYHLGLPGELPETILVAHKEGDLEEEGGVANDAGVVFCRRPYLLVVLSSGVGDLDEGFRDIARLSKMAFDYQEKIAG